MQQYNGDDFVVVSFEDGKATFDIRVADPAQVLTAMLGLEGWVATELGLEAFDIREILDEMKSEVIVTEKTSLIEDAEVEDAIPVK